MMQAAIKLVFILIHKAVAESPTVTNIYYQNPNDCTKFTIGLNEAVTYECPRGYHWNNYMNRCDLSESKTSTTPKYYYSYSHAYNPIGHDAASRYEISRLARPLEMQCRQGYTFNSYTNRCEVLPTASRPKTPYLAPRFHTVPPGTSSIGCPRIVDPNNPVYRPHSDCAKFYMCTPSGPEEWSCPDGLHWSETVNRCDQSWRAGCRRDDRVISVVKSTMNPVTTTTTTTTIRSSHFIASTAATPYYSLTTTASDDNFGGVTEDTTIWEDFYTTDSSIL
ncbi:AAEL002482-PA [Aedes aegypti]|nr:AAEL002482-PA [Aedes aegypti]